MVVLFKFLLEPMLKTDLMISLLVLLTAVVQPAFIARDFINYRHDKKSHCLIPEFTTGVDNVLVSVHLQHRTWKALSKDGAIDVSIAMQLTENFKFIKSSRQTFECSVKDCHAAFMTNGRDAMFHFLEMHLDPDIAPFKCARCNIGFQKYVHAVEHIDECKNSPKSEQFIPKSSEQIPSKELRSANNEHKKCQKPYEKAHNTGNKRNASEAANDAQSSPKRFRPADIEGYQEFIFENAFLIPVASSTVVNSRQTINQRPENSHDSLPPISQFISEIQTLSHQVNNLPYHANLSSLRSRNGSSFLSRSYLPSNTTPILASQPSLFTSRSLRSTTDRSAKSASDYRQANSMHSEINPGFTMQNNFHFIEHPCDQNELLNDPWQ